MFICDGDGRSVKNAAFSIYIYGDIKLKTSLRIWCVLQPADFEFSRLESWSRDVSRLVFTSLGLGLGLEPRSLGFGSWNLRVLVFDLG